MVSLTEIFVVLYFPECPPPGYGSVRYKAPVDEECSASRWVLQPLMKS